MARVYVDSCIMIYVAENTPGHGAQARQMIIDGFGEQDLFISDLVRLECRVKPLRLKNAGLLREYDLLFTKFGKLVHSPQAFDLATELRALNGLPTPDAIHVATAILGDCDELWTNDDRMAKAKIPISIRLLT